LHADDGVHFAMNAMADLPPWIVEGVEPEAQEAAKMTARRANVSVGVWLTHTIMSAASNELRRASPAREGNFQPPALTTDVLLKGIKKLAERIETAEQRAAESITPLAEKVTTLSQRIEDVSTRASTATVPVERALSRMAERLERLERSPGAEGSDSDKPRRRGCGHRVPKKRRRANCLSRAA
jgi:hypothetical protein